MRARVISCALSLGLAGLVSAPPAAADVKIFRTDARESFLEGTLEGVSVDALGSLGLSHRLERLTAIEEPFVFSAAAHPDGWVLGTGNAGKVLLVRRDGAVEELFATAEPEVFAVWADDDGAVVAASSPAGKVYRHAGGETRVLFDPEERYVWALERARDGRLLVATGLPGRLYAVDRDGEAELLLDSGDSHLRAVLPRDDGSILAGTAGRGLVLRRGADGRVETVYDGVEPEVLAFAAGPDGRVYAAVLASEASYVDLSATSASTAAAAEGQEEGEGQVSVSVSQGQETTIGSRSASASGPRSVVLELGPAGAEEVLSFEDDTVHSLLAHGGELWIGTGQAGKLFRLSERRALLERDLEERQITALVGRGREAAVVTTNGAALYRLPGGAEAEGSYLGPVLDAGAPARFGSFLWRGELPAGSAVGLAFRSGMSARPDATWTPWITPSEASPSAREVSLSGLAEGRYVQWRATLRAGGDGRGPRLAAAELSYEQLNLRPSLDGLEVLAAGEVLVPSSFNPQNQVFEPWSPNREGIFTTLRPETPSDDGRLKSLWKRGWRTVRWQAEDPNADTLVYRLSVRREADADGWLEIVSELDESHFSFDSTVLPDGLYRFRVEAADRPAHRSGEALTAERTSPPAVVDHSAPEIVASRREGGVIEVEVRDVWSPLREAMVSVDAGEWRPATAADGLVDGRRETLRVEVPEGARVLLLRLTDAAFNGITVDLLDGGR